jgi:hypothetical protein
MPIELIEDKNTDQFPKTKKIAKGMHSYLFVHFDSRKQQFRFSSLTILQSIIPSSSGQTCFEIAED